MSERPTAEKDACDGCQKRPCVCETVVLPTAEKDAAPVVQWAHVLDDTGSADLYDTEAEARESLALVGGGLDRIETTTVVPFSVFPPGDRHTCRHCGGPLGDAFDSDDHTCRTNPMPPAMADTPCPEAAVLLDALWDLYWNGPGSCDYGDHAGYTWAEDQALSDRAEAVEDHYTIHGCRPIPPGSDPQ